MYRPFLIVLSTVLMLAGCNEQAMFEKFVPHEEAAVAKQLISELAVKDYAAVEKQLDSSLQPSSIRGALEQMASVFPASQPARINTVGSNTSTINGVTTYDFTFEHEYPGSWLLTNVVLQRRDGRLTVLGMHVNPMKQSLEETNRFTFKGKGILHYAVFALAIAIPLFILFTLVVWYRTPIAKRKWLWFLFVVLGVVQFSLNWTDGGYAIQPIYFALLGAGFFRASPYAPFIFNISVPIGAIVFLAKRRSWAAQNDRRT